MWLKITILINQQKNRERVKDKQLSGLVRDIPNLHIMSTKLTADP